MGWVTQITNISSLQLSSLTVQDQGANTFGVWLEPTSWFIDNHSIIVSSHGKKKGQALRGFVLRALIFFMRALLSWLNHLPEASSPITMMLEMSTYEFWGDTFSLYQVPTIWQSLFLLFQTQGWITDPSALEALTFNDTVGSKHIKKVNDTILKLFCAVLTCWSWNFVETGITCHV